MSFTRMEKIGIATLLVLLSLLVVVRASIQYWVQPGQESAQQQKLVQAWEDFKAQNANPPLAAKVDTIKPVKSKTIKERVPAKQNPGLFPFDPNTVDSITMRKLGLKEKTTTILLHWRTKGKVFHRKEELKKLYTLSEEEYNRLEPYIEIKGAK